MGTSDLQYWASLPTDELAKRAWDKVLAYRRWFRATGQAERAAKGWRYGNGWTDAGESSSRVQMGGERNALLKVVVNGVRPLRQRTLAMVLSGAPEMQPVTANSDADAREQADLSRGVLEHVHRVHKREELDREALAMALDMGEAFTVVEWDAMAGRVVATDEEGEPALWEGDFRYWVASAFDLYRDVALRSYNPPWIIARRLVSRYRLAATCPEKADEILRAGREGYSGEEYDFISRLWDNTAETDLVEEYVLWHLDTPELPGGVELRFLSGGIPLGPSKPYPYEGQDLPAKRIAPEGVSLTSMGHSNLFDALGLSDLINSIVSGMSTNVAKGAVPPLINPKGSGVAAGPPLGTGHLVLNISRKEEAPFYLEPPQTSPEAYKLLEVLERMRLEAFGLNETTMGRPPYSGMAAQAMALMDSKADEYQDGLRKSFLAYLASTATFELRILKRFAKEERIAQIAGKAKQWMTKSYTADSLSKVDAIHVEPVGMAARTVSGKFGLLETFSNFGVPLKPEQIVELAQTGQYESDFEAPLAKRYGIQEENEDLRTGARPHVALMSDAHWEHIAEHLSIVDSPEARLQPGLADRVMRAVEEHLGLWRTMPPDLLALRGGPPPPMPPGMAPMGLPPETGAPMPPMPEGEPAPAAASAQGAVSALDPNAEAPTLPQPPGPPMAA